MMTAIPTTSDEIIKTMTDEQKALMFVNMRTLYDKLGVYEQAELRAWYEGITSLLSKKNKYF